MVISPSRAVKLIEAFSEHNDPVQLLISITSNRDLSFKFFIESEEFVLSRKTGQLCVYPAKRIPVSQLPQNLHDQRALLAWHWVNENVERTHHFPIWRGCAVGEGGLMFHSSERANMTPLQIIEYAKTLGYPL